MGVPQGLVLGPIYNNTLTTIPNYSLNVKYVPFLHQ